MKEVALWNGRVCINIKFGVDSSLFLEDQVMNFKQKVEEVL